MDIETAIPTNEPCANPVGQGMHSSGTGRQYRYAAIAQRLAHAPIPGRLAQRSCLGIPIGFALQLVVADLLEAGHELVIRRHGLLDHRRGHLIFGNAHLFDNCLRRSPAWFGLWNSRPAAPA